jgi:hypothetical protein
MEPATSNIPNAAFGLVMLPSCPLPSPSASGELSGQTWQKSRSRPGADELRRHPGDVVCHVDGVAGNIQDAHRAIPILVEAGQSTYRVRNPRRRGYFATTCSKVSGPSNEGGQVPTGGVAPAAPLAPAPLAASVRAVTSGAVRALISYLLGSPQYPSWTISPRGTQVKGGFSSYPLTSRHRVPAVTRGSSPCCVPARAARRATARPLLRCRTVGRFQAPMTTSIVIPRSRRAACARRARSPRCRWRRAGPLPSQCRGR